MICAAFFMSVALNPERNKKGPVTRTGPNNYAVLVRVIRDCQTGAAET